MIDIDLLFGAFWQPFRWLIPLLLIGAGLKLAFKARVQGAIGEAAVAKTAGNYSLDALHDIVLTDERGGLTQVDHVLLTGAGILVIETKSFSGRIFGQARDKSWTQRMGRQSFRIGNPLRQNYGHFRAVKSIVGPDIPVTGKVVITGPAEFPNGMPEGVLTRSALRAELKRMGGGQPDRPEWTTAWERLKAKARTDRDARKSHKEQLQSRFGRDFRPQVGLACIAAGVILAAWFWVT